MTQFQVEFYENERGQQPAKEFILKMDKKMQAKMMSVISVLQDNGNQLREPYSRHISDGIFELRAKVGTDISRVLYFFYYGNRIILTNGFMKKTQKTPQREVNKAKAYRTEFLSREEHV